MARTGTGVDIGHSTAKFLRGSVKGNTFQVTAFDVVPYRTESPTAGWDEVELDFKPTNARIGLTGRDVNIRYSRVPRVPDWQLRKLMQFEVAEIGDQSGTGVASDFNLLPEIPEVEGEDIVLLGMARETLLDAHLDGLSSVGGTLDAFSPNAIALYNAWVRYGVVQEETVMLANIGHDNLDVVIARGPDLLFARNLSGGSRLFDQAIAQRFNCSEKKAEELKIDHVDLDPNARFGDSTTEKASRAVLGAAGQLLSLLQSTVSFCKSQIKLSGLKVDRVFLCGGGAALKGLPEYLRSGMNVPVELFEPFQVVDVSALDPEAAEKLDEFKLEAVVALGLATMASDADAYSVEVLPARIVRRRQFWGRTAWLAAAGILALGYLGYDAYNTRTELSEVKQVAQRVNRDLKSATATHKKTNELLEENKKLSDLAYLLQGVIGTGEMSARALETLDRTLPGDFWITQLETTWSLEPELGVERGGERPICRIRGKSRQGTEALHTQFQQYVDSLHVDPRVQLKPTLSPDGTEFRVDFTPFTLPGMAPEPPDADAPAEEE